MIESGTILDSRYEVQEALAKGGYAVLYAARRVSDGEPVVIKLLRTDVMRADNKAADRFIREAGAAVLLDHPNIVKTLDFGQLSDHTPWIVLERLRGTTLSKLILDQPQPVTLVADLLRQMLRALTHAHDQGMVHRDIKPANVFVCDPNEQDIPDSERVKLLDFGFVKVFGSEDELLNKPLTLIGQAVGTPGYMAPELFMGGEVAPRLDLYSAGIIAYELLTGSLAYPGEGMQRAIVQVRQDPATPGPEVTETRLWPIVQRLYARDIDTRYPTAPAALADIDAVYPEGEVEEKVTGFGRWLGFFRKRKK